jgi:polyhydroxyalkanoate synthesis repressor PhaR
MARTIKRYDNRKLYDTEASSYVSQRDIAEMVRTGETVRIVDNSTGEDLTAQTLTQIILDEGKDGGPGLLPSDMLHGLLRRGSQALDQTLGKGARQVNRQVNQGFSQVKSGLDDLVHQSFSRLNRLTGSARSSEVEALHEQLARLETRLAEVLDRVEDDRQEDRQDDSPDSGAPGADGTSVPATEKPDSTPASY